LRIKEQETRLTLQEHDDDDDDEYIDIKIIVITNDIRNKIIRKLIQTVVAFSSFASFGV